MGVSEGILRQSLKQKTRDFSVGLGIRMQTKTNSRFETPPFRSHCP